MDDALRTDLKTACVSRQQISASRLDSSTMSTFTRLTYHVVFGTKFRRNRIVEPFGDELYSYIGGIIRGEQGALLEIGGMPDHVHIFAAFSPAISVSDMLRRIKAKSSKWANDHQKLIDHFEWQKGYGAFTVSQSQIETVRDYIRNQEEHHRQKTFKDEFVNLLERHGIQFEERYLFEDEHVG
jgi:putative transposase